MGFKRVGINRVRNCTWVGIVSIPKKSKNKQIFIDRVRNDQVKNGRGLEMNCSRGKYS